MKVHPKRLKSIHFKGYFNKNFIQKWTSCTKIYKSIVVRKLMRILRNSFLKNSKLWGKSCMRNWNSRRMKIWLFWKALRKIHIRPTSHISKSILKCIVVPISEESQEMDAATGKSSPWSRVRRYTSELSTTFWKRLYCMISYLYSWRVLKPKLISYTLSKKSSQCSKSRTSWK